MWTVKSKHQQQSDASEQTPKLGLATPKVIPAGYKYEGVGFTMSSRRMGLAVHRLFNTSNGNHLYTINNVGLPWIWFHSGNTITHALQSKASVRLQTFQDPPYPLQ
ncbi:MAG: hypothetical protein RI932_1486 [Pseudomonadota bacterium]|jgi:hypothetical protein